MKGLPRERGTVVVYQVNGSRVEWNPSAARLRELTEKMPNAAVTEFGNVILAFDHSDERICRGPNRMRVFERFLELARNEGAAT